MEITARKIASLSDEITVNYSGRYPEIPATDVLWYETYTKPIHEAGLMIVVLDFPSNTLERIIRNRSILDLPMWCFFRRGTIMSTVVSSLINQHLKRLQDKAVQRAFPYDEPSNISSWVESKFLALC